jgi:glycine dehydrogenase (decarboxylating) beta subunit (EC 1.4.4.2)
MNKIRQTRNAQLFEEPLIFELSQKGKASFTIYNDDLEDIELNLPKEFLREDINLPEVSEPEVVRHFTRLSTWNYGIDLGFYPLGSCTMKYNPRINEEIANNTYFLQLHPAIEEKYIQTLLKLVYELQELIKTITDMPAVTLQPAAGAHGELTGIFLIRAYHKAKGNSKKDTILIPDSAHGTNPATCSFAGFKVKELKGIL